MWLRRGVPAPAPRTLFAKELCDIIVSLEAACSSSGKMVGYLLRASTTWRLKPVSNVWAGGPVTDR